MEIAIEESKKSLLTDDIPVGCVIVKNERVVTKSHNKVEEFKNITLHAEIIAIQEAQKILNKKFLDDCSLFVSLEPCIMCSGALSLSRIKEVYFSAYAPKFGGLSSLYQIGKDKRLNHRFESEGGILENESTTILKKFFEKLRS